MPGLVLSEQLSAAYVAFTLEADDLAEQRINHHTTRGGPAPDGAGRTVWLTSLAMWFTCMRWLPEGGITVQELRRRARTGTNLDGMRRWGYVTIVPSGRSGPARYPDDAVIAPTRRGRAAQKAWRDVAAEVEQRWSERFGDAEVLRLRAALLAIVTELELVLPDCMPILGYGLSCRRGLDPSLADLPPRGAAARERDATLPLVCLLARVLLALALAYEDGARISLAIQENIISWLGDGPVALRELPARAAVSREGLEMGLGFLERAGCAVTEPLPGRARGRQALLTDKGGNARLAGARRLGHIHAELARRHGRRNVSELSAALAPITGDATREGSPLFAGLQPSPGSWRAGVEPPVRLPRFPMVLHRGGYPDGA